MKGANYPYIQEDVLNKKVSYSYSEYGGMKFINDWKAVREDFIKKMNPQPHSFSLKEGTGWCSQLSASPSPSEITFHSWIESLLKSEADFDKIDLLLKRFEVSKKIYGTYDDDFRPVVKGDFLRIANYVKFGCVLALSYRATGKLQYLNTLLKLNDILCSLFERMEENEKPLVGWLLYSEIEFVETLMDRRLIHRDS